MNPPRPENLALLSPRPMRSPSEASRRALSWLEPEAETPPRELRRPSEGPSGATARTESMAASIAMAPSATARVKRPSSLSIPVAQLSPEPGPLTPPIEPLAKRRLCIGPFVQTQVVCVREDASAAIAQDIMEKAQCWIALVESRKGEVRGVLTRGDLQACSPATVETAITKLERRQHLWSIPVMAIARKGVLSVDVQASVSEAARLLRKSASGCLIVTEGGRRLGILTRDDLLCILEQIPDPWHWPTEVRPRHAGEPEAERSGDQRLNLSRARDHREWAPWLKAGAGDSRESMT